MRVPVSGVRLFLFYRLLLIIVVNFLTSAEARTLRSAGSPCSDGFFVCDDGTKCIPMNKRCDLTEDCDDKSDEFGCICIAFNRIPCKTPNECFKEKSKCDGVSNCSDGSDEEDCPSLDFLSTTQPPTSSVAPPPILTSDSSDKIIPTETATDPFYKDSETSTTNLFSLDTPSPSISTDMTTQQFLSTPTSTPSENKIILPKETATVPQTDSGTALPSTVVTKSCGQAGWKQCKAKAECYDPKTECDKVNDCSDGTDEERCQSSSNTTTPPSALSSTTPFLSNSSDISTNALFLTPIVQVTSSTIQPPISSVSSLATPPIPTVTPIFPSKTPLISPLSSPNSISPSTMRPLNSSSVSLTTLGKHLPSTIFPSNTPFLPSSGPLALSFSSTIYPSNSILPLSTPHLPSLSLAGVPYTNVLKMTANSASKTSTYAFSPYPLTVQSSSVLPEPKNSTRKASSLSTESKTNSVLSEGLNCNEVGTSVRHGEKTRKACPCKKYVTGILCDDCKDKTFHLHEKNKHGCLKCFCMNKSKVCHSSALYRTKIRTENISCPLKSKSKEKNRTIDRKKYKNMRSNRSCQLPREFLGDKISSYGGLLKMDLRGVSRNATIHLFLRGYGLKLVHRNTKRKEGMLNAGKEKRKKKRKGRTQGRKLPTAKKGRKIRVKLVEKNWKLLMASKRSRELRRASREDLITVLAALRSLTLRITTADTLTPRITLRKVSLDVATSNHSTSKGEALEVEECECPEGYTGTSCQTCSQGYRKVQVKYGPQEYIRFVCRKETTQSIVNYKFKFCLAFRPGIGLLPPHQNNHFQYCISRTGRQKLQ